MRQTVLLNVVVLAFFVLLFHSVYRRRPSERLRLWIAAWMAAVLHFAVLLWEPSSVRGSQAVEALSDVALMACGICFILSLPVIGATGRRRTAALALGTPCLIFGFCSAFHLHAVSVFLLVALAAHGLALVLLWSFYREQLTVTIPATALLLACSEWSSVEIVAHHSDDALGVFLMELFAMYALLFAHDFKRRSAGIWTTIAGLSAWAAVFPIGMLLDRYWPAVPIDPEIWNVPKVVVAFGMLVTLFEEELISSQRERTQYQQLFDANPLPMWIFDKDSTRLQLANAAARRDFGWGREDLGTLTISNLAAEEQSSPVGLEEMNWRLAADSPRDTDASTNTGFREQSVSAPAMRFLTKSGEERTVEVTLQRASFHEKEARLLVAKDITAEVEVRAQLLHQANHDPLTGLANRLLLQDRLESAVAGGTRYGSKAAVLCIDLDRFKQINDTYGHAAGDSCLREVGRRLQHRLRSVDTAARTGGEEFMVILEDVGSSEQAGKVVNDLLFSLSLPHTCDGQRIHLSASIGIALFPDDGLTPSELWNMADAAMYRAKQSGGNRRQFFSGVR